MPFVWFLIGACHKLSRMGQEDSLETNSIQLDFKILRLWEISTLRSRNLNVSKVGIIVSVRKKGQGQKGSWFCKQKQKGRRQYVRMEFMTQNNDEEINTRRRQLRCVVHHGVVGTGAGKRWECRERESKEQRSKSMMPVNRMATCHPSL